MYHTHYQFSRALIFAFKEILVVSAPDVDFCDAGTHDEAKAFLQKQYFYMDTPDLSIPLFAFVGRVTQQKVFR